jgi:hypothetical protein
VVHLNFFRNGSLLGTLAVILQSCFGASAAQFQQNGSLLLMSNANVSIQYDLTNGEAAFYWQGRQIISAFYGGATLSNGYVKGTNYTSWSWTMLASNEVAVTATGNGHPAMKQYFTLDQTNSFLAQLEMDGTALSANWMGPIVVDSGGAVDIGSYNDDRALFVPFDNDHFITYNAMPIDSSDTSYEVGAFYDDISRNGLVVGSVTHDVWKSGIYWSGSANKLNQMNVFGGAVSPNVTWDTMPHGSVTGNAIQSPVMFVGFDLDWRNAMKSFAAENTLMAPKLTWTNGVPFGWNSWGVIETGINYTDATNASAFVKNNLQSSNFNNNGTVYINLDSYYDNLSGAQLLAFVNYCHSNGQKAGVYWTPFVWWGSADYAASSTVEGSSYTYSQALLKNSTGGYETNDGALAMDLTHPATKIRINYYIDEFRSWGFDYIKLDFLTHGALEGVHYDTNVTTGMEAYTEGMRYLTNQINGSMFISESIAPIFPYQYAHSRRIACDAYTSYINNTQYTLNSVSYGWWLDGLYTFNDPDILVFQGPTTNENQSRLICGAITGLFLNGDSFTNAASRSDAERCLTNAAIDAVARIGQTFIPADGNTGTNASTVFSLQEGATWYLAVFNYSATATTTNIDLSRAGITGSYAAQDLWTGAVLPVTANFWRVSLNAKQGRLFKMLNVPALQSPWTGAGVFGFSIAGNAGNTYLIQSTTDLINWNTVETVTNSADVQAFTLTNAPGSGQFYRVTTSQ